MIWNKNPAHNAIVNAWNQHLAVHEKVSQTALFATNVAAPKSHTMGSRLGVVISKWACFTLVGISTMVLEAIRSIPAVAKGNFIAALAASPRCLPTTALTIATNTFADKFALCSPCCESQK